MATVVRTPVHLWIVGILAVLWNCVGAFDYVMTETRNAAYLANFSDAERTYFESFPALMVTFWALGVWGGLLGSLLLLLRNRWAVPAFSLSVVGILVTALYQFVLSPAPDSLWVPAMIGLNVAICVIAIALVIYAMKMRDRGVLR
jgi:hypothetical protein